MEAKQRDEIVKFYISSMKSTELDDTTKLGMLLELDKTGPIFDFLLYNIFNNVKNRFIQRQCVIMIGDRYLKVLIDNNKEWFDED